jgi:hypothetical protein
MRAIVLLAITGVLAGSTGQASASTGQARSATYCAPPHGPGDNLIHSANLRVKGINCAQGRAVALRCDGFSYGHYGHCNAVGIRWYCTSYAREGTSSHERCSAGFRIMAIDWLD